MQRRRPERTALTPEPPALPPPPPDTGVAPTPDAEQPPVGRIGPGLAEGRLWVRPLPLPPKELAKRLKKSHTDLVDSAVTAVVQGYLDSIASDPMARNVGMPSWVTEVAGKKFGLDAKNIYVAGLKIPAVVLALLPIPQGNIDQNQAYNHLMAMRSDLQHAAQRSQNLEEFKLDDPRHAHPQRAGARVRAEPTDRAAAPGAGHTVGRETSSGGSRMKLVDTDETVVLVTGASITAEERDLPLAHVLKT